MSVGRRFGSGIGYPGSAGDTLGKSVQQMLDSGAWAKVGRSCYRHESGIEVCKVRGGWQTSSQPGIPWSRLWVAVSEAEKDANGRRR